MNGDYFDKLLQGAALCKFQDHILNVTENDLKKCMDDNKVGEQHASKSTHHESVLGTSDTNGIKQGCAQQKEGQTDEWITIQSKKAKKDEKRQQK
jgi:hypothetical protein